jgi:hypothetical protein
MFSVVTTTFKRMQANKRAGYKRVCLVPAEMLG